MLKLICVQSWINFDRVNKPLLSYDSSDYGSYWDFLFCNVHLVESWYNSYEAWFGHVMIDLMVIVTNMM